MDNPSRCFYGIEEVKKGYQIVVLYKKPGMDKIALDVLNHARNTTLDDYHVEKMDVIDGPINYKISVIKVLK